MAYVDENAPKMHYICQTYVQKAMSSGLTRLEIDKQFQYKSASEAEERASRESRSERCAGADAYMVVEDPSSGEVSTPTFLARLGAVPEFDAF